MFSHNSTATKTISAALLLGFSLNVFALPFYAHAQTGPASGGGGVTAPVPVQPSLQGLSQLFSIGGAGCGPGGIGGSILGLASQALGGLKTLGELFEGASGSGGGLPSLPPVGEISPGDDFLFEIEEGNEAISSVPGGGLPSLPPVGEISPGDDFLFEIEEGNEAISSVPGGGTPFGPASGGGSATAPGGGSPTGPSSGGGSATAPALGGISGGSFIQGIQGALQVFSLVSSFFGGGSEVPVRDKVTRNATTKTAGNTTEILKKECVYDPLSRAIAVFIIRPITQAILGWIQGEANFVQNLEAELRLAADIRGAEFLNQLAGINLCGNLGLTLPPSLRTPGYTRVREQFECTVTDIIANVENHFADFNQGGWEVFYELSYTLQNNPYGAFLLGLANKTAAESARINTIQREFEVGKGFLGFQVPVSVCDGEGLCHTETKTKTPGQLAASLLNKSVEAELSQLFLADEIDESIYAILNAMIQKLLGFSFGSSGEGIFNQSLGNFTQVNPGDFSDSTVQVQLAGDINTADQGLLALEDRIKNAVSEAFSKAVQVKQLEADIEECENDIDCDDDELEDLKEKRDKAQADLNKAKDAFIFARDTRKNIIVLKSEMLKLKQILLTTDSIADVQQIAEDRIVLANLLDGFFELASIFAGGPLINTSLKGSTESQLDGASALSNSAKALITKTQQEIGASGLGGFSGIQQQLSSLESSFNQILQNIASFKSSFSQLTNQSDVNQGALASIPLVNGTTKKILDVDTQVKQALDAL